MVRAPSDAFSEASAKVVTDLAEVISTHELAALGVDTPIGLDPEPRPGGRPADRAARALLARMAPDGLRATGSRVFSAPSAGQLAAWRAGAGYDQVNLVHEHGPRLTLQAFNILPKIAAADAMAQGPHGARLFEVHPEVSFAALADETLPRKKSATGRARRVELLEGLGFRLAALEAGLGPRAGRWQADDLWDACICCWSAGRIARGIAWRLPGDGDNGVIWA